MRFESILITLVVALWDDISVNASGATVGRRRRSGGNRRPNDAETPSIRSLKSKGKGKGTSEESMEVESLEDADPSNDGSYLEDLCYLFEGYQGRDCSTDGRVFEEALLCPSSYEQSKICDALAYGVASDRQDAVTKAYCGPIFAGWNVNPPDSTLIEQCVGYCVEFMDANDDCCDLPC